MYYSVDVLTGGRVAKIVRMYGEAGNLLVHSQFLLL